MLAATVKPPMPIKTGLQNAAGDLWPAVSMEDHFVGHRDIGPGAKRSAPRQAHTGPD